VRHYDPSRDTTRWSLVLTREVVVVPAMCVLIALAPSSANHWPVGHEEHLAPGIGEVGVTSVTGFRWIR
jgi:hypothetical protein